MISKVLVANRGEIARRVFRTCRQLGIATVAVHSEPDANEPHVGEADESILLEGSSPADTYLNIVSVMDAALRSHADAVHPGYGFLAENPDFARAVNNAGLIWIGPTPEAIEIMGSKLESKKLVEGIGVPNLTSIEIIKGSDLFSAAEAIGYPVLVKASAGGGGKGMRIVDDPDDLVEAVASSRREAASAFGDDTVFLEGYLQAPRHIEIQVFGDQHGNVVSLHERECSIQRRHQKIIEESPSPAIDQATRSAMGDAAVRAARAVSYVGAGTVEFLFQDSEFFFLEMNTRLQVEHPVTEMVTGLDLVQLQIEVANGELLPKEIPPINGHAIEARLYAEDALNDFLPVTGHINRFRFEPRNGLRVDSGVEDGSTVSVHYDPMIAKVIAHAPSRTEAAAALASALRTAEIHGSTTNRALLVRILEHEEFLDGDTDTHFLQRHDPSELGSPLANRHHELAAAVASAITDQADSRARAVVLASIPTGWRNLKSQPQQRSYEGFHGVYDVGYIVPDEFEVDDLGRVTVMAADPNRVTLSIEGTETNYRVNRSGRDRFVDSEGIPAQIQAVDRFPQTMGEEDVGSLHAPMPGKVIRVDVTEGDTVTEGQVLVVIEAMKMEHTLKAPYDGVVARVTHLAQEQVEADAILVVVEPN